MLRVVYPRVHRWAQPIVLKILIIVPRLTGDAAAGHEFVGQVEQAGPDQEEHEPHAEFSRQEAVQHQVPDPGNEGVQGHPLECGHQDILAVSMIIRIMLLTNCQVRKNVLIGENRHGWTRLATVAS